METIGPLAEDVQQQVDFARRLFLQMNFPVLSGKKKCANKIVGAVKNLLGAIAHSKPGNDYPALPVQLARR